MDDTSCVTGAWIYGRDDRREASQVEEPWRALARDRTVAFVERWVLDNLDERNLGIEDFSLERSFGVCSNERFAEQPAIAACTGILVRSDLVLTAAHCVTRPSDCDAHAFVRHFALDQVGVWEGPGADDVSACASVEVADTALDLALVRLTTPFPSSTPLSIRADAPRLGERVIAIGYPEGLPAKVDDGGRIVSVPKNGVGYYTADTDTFGGSSGGAVFDVNGALAGVSLGGRTDYRVDVALGCYRENRGSANDGKDAERLAPIADALNALCDGGAVSACSLRGTATAPPVPAGCQ